MEDVAQVSPKLASAATSWTWSIVWAILSSAIPIINPAIFIWLIVFAIAYWRYNQGKWYQFNKQAAWKAYLTTVAIFIIPMIIMARIGSKVLLSI